MTRFSANQLLDRLSSTSPAWLLGLAATVLIVISALDWILGVAVTLGALYLLPVLLVSGILPRAQLLSVAFLCAILRLLGAPPITLVEGVMNGLFAITAYALIGVFAAELIRSRRETALHLSEIERQHELRVRAEEELRLLAESSPAAVFTLNENGEILSANRATRELLGATHPNDLMGASIAANLPVLMDALQLDKGLAAFRTVSQVQGSRFDGSPFFAQACFSTYRTDDGRPRLAAIAFDATEDLREREEQNLQQMSESNRIAAGAVAHEVRNICGAMSALYANLEAIPEAGRSRDFEGLGRLIEGLGKLAELELTRREDPLTGSADLRDVLNLLRILIAPAWEDDGAAIEWPDFQQPILVAVDAFALLQVFLNIANNSRRALAQNDQKQMRIRLQEHAAVVSIRFEDSGPGVSNRDQLFQPFRSGIGATGVRSDGSAGLGLYICRGLIRRYGGDLRYEEAPTGGAGFLIEAPLFGVEKDVYFGFANDPALAG